MKSLVLAVPIVLVACSVVRPISLPAPSSREDRPTTYSALLVTDTTGRAQWVYDARVDGDTLRGVQNPQAGRERIAVPLSQVKSVAAARFSPGRTVGLVGSLAGAVLAIALLIPVDPVYSGLDR